MQCKERKLIEDLSNVSDIIHFQLYQKEVHIKEVTVLDAVNLSVLMQNTYLLCNSLRPTDMHKAFNRAECTGHMSSMKALITVGAHKAHKLKAGVPCLPLILQWL